MRSNWRKLRFYVFMYFLFVFIFKHVLVEVIVTWSEGEKGSAGLTCQANWASETRVTNRTNMFSWGIQSTLFIWSWGGRCVASAVFSFEQLTRRVHTVMWNDADRHWRADRIILHRKLFSTSSPPPRCIIVYAHLFAIRRDTLDQKPGRKVYFGCQAKESVAASVWTSVGWIRQAVLQHSSGEIIQLKEHKKNGNSTWTF